METIINHIGVIIDGNRRWAKERGLPTLRRHRRRMERVGQLRKSCQEKGIKILTIYVFSTENRKRTEKEVTYLMELIKEAFTQKKEVQQPHKDGVKVRFLGHYSKRT